MKSLIKCLEMNWMAILVSQCSAFVESFTVCLMLTRDPENLYCVSSGVEIVLFCSLSKLYSTVSNVVACVTCSFFCTALMSLPLEPQHEPCWNAELVCEIVWNSYSCDLKVCSFAARMTSIVLNIMNSWEYQVQYVGAQLSRTIALVRNAELHLLFTMCFVVELESS
jgi:hypothetical protein